MIGASVLFYGEGDGTWVMGKPGFPVPAQPGMAGRDAGSRWCLTSIGGHTWRGAGRPGHFKRWYLRAFQEEFDARLYPYGWDEPDSSRTEAGAPRPVYSAGGDKPSICGTFADGMDSEGDPKLCSLRARSVPMLKEMCWADSAERVPCLEWHAPAGGVL